MTDEEHAALRNHLVVQEGPICDEVCMDAHAPKNEPKYQCTHPKCGATGTWEQIKKHQKEDHK